MNRVKNTLLSCLLLAGGLAGFPSGAMAADALFNCFSGQPFLWPGGGANIPFNPDQGDLNSGIPFIDNPTGVALVHAAFDNWTAAGPFSVPTSATYVNAGQLPVDVDVTNFGPFLSPPAPDGLSAIVFDADGAIFTLLFGAGSGILGFAGPEWGDFVTCDILEGVSFLNGPAFTNLTAAEDVMTHEFGHYSNLGHVELNGQLEPFFEGGDTSGPTPDDPFVFGGVLSGEVESMYPFYFGPGSGTLSPHADDVASLATLYPDAGFFATTGSIRGTIYAPDGVTRLSGVNVTARNVADPMLDAVSTFSGAFTDSTSQADPNVGVYELNNLTPGADYVVFIDVVTANPGRFSNHVLTPLPGPEEYWNTDEDNEDPPDEPLDANLVVPVAGSPATGIDIIINQPSPGDPLLVGDDGFVELSIGFPFEICGREFHSVFVNANGNLTFGSGDSDWTESAAEFLSDQPRIAALWDDLSPYHLITGAQQGLVTFGRTRNSFSVIFEDVPEFLTIGSNSFEITLKRSSNHIDIEYGDISAADGLAGVSCGGRDTSGFEMEEDLTSSGRRRIRLQRSPARYEQFTALDNDLSGATVRFNGTTDYNDNWIEPNDSIADARHLNLSFNSIPVHRYTEIEPTGGDVDFFSFHASANTTLVAEIIGGQLDSLIGVFDSGGSLIAVDDDSGVGLRSRLYVPITADGEYFLAVTAFPDFGFTGAGGSGGRYVLDLFTVDGTVLNLSDDDTEEVALGFNFPFNGNNYSSVWVNSNGSLTFGSGDTDWTESVAEFLNDQPRIAPLWDDLNPNTGGLVLIEFDTNEVTVIFDSVPEFLAAGANTFMVTLRADGSLTFEYGALSATDGLAGTTEGGGAADPGETDLDAGGPYPKAGTTYESFSGNDNDLDDDDLEFDQ
jgi:hypothetical protein